MASNQRFSPHTLRAACASRLIGKNGARRKIDAQTLDCGPNTHMNKEREAQRLRQAIKEGYSSVKERRAARPVPNRKNTSHHRAGASVPWSKCADGPSHDLSILARRTVRTSQQDALARNGQAASSSQPFLRTIPWRSLASPTASVRHESSGSSAAAGSGI